METQTQAMDDEEVRVDDNVDQLFEEKMKKLKEIGLYDDRMMEKMNLIHSMTTGQPSVPTNKRVVRGAVLGRPDYRANDLQAFEGEDENPLGAQTFKPIENSGFKWSLPFRQKRKRSPSPTGDRDRDHERERDYRDSDRSRDRDRYRDRERNGVNDGQNIDRDVKVKTEDHYGDNEMVGTSDGRHRDRDDTNNDRYREREERVGTSDDNYESRVKVESDVQMNDRRNDYESAVTSGESRRRKKMNEKVEKELKAIKIQNFFESRKSKAVETKSGGITDIEAFIKECNKKAEKPKPLIIDDIDDFIANANKRFAKISANLDSIEKKSKRK